MEATHHPDTSNYGGLCAMITLILEVIKKDVLSDLQMILVIAQIVLALTGSAFYYFSIKKIKKEDK